MLKILFRLTILTCFSWSAYGIDCQSALSSNVISLPRELKLTSEGVDFLAQNEAHRKTLMTLAKVFSILENPKTDLYELAKLLSVRATEEELARQEWSNNPFLRARENLVTPAVQSNYFNLFHSPLAELFDEDSLGLFALLAKDIPQGPRDAITYKIIQATPDEMSKAKMNGQQRAQNLLSNPRSRETILKLLDADRESLIPKTESQPHNSFSRKANLDYAKSSVLGPVTQMSASDAGLQDKLIEQSKILEKQLSNGTRTTQFLQVTHATLFFMEPRIAGYSEKRFPKVFTHSVQGGRDYLTMHRIGFNEAASQYLAEVLQITSAINPIVDVLEYFFFAAPLPLESDVLRTLMIDSAKSFLLPLKNEYSTFKAKSHALPTSQFNLPPLQLRLVDHFSPKNTPKVRATKTGAIDSAAETAPSINIEQQIPSEQSLRAFTNYSENPRSLNELASQTTYQFWFLRDVELTLQKVEMSENATNWIKDHPEEGQLALNALHMGRARSTGQSGIKLVMSRSAHYKGQVYELKFHGNMRGLMIQHNGVWRLIEFTKKDTFDRAVNQLSPL